MSLLYKETYGVCWTGCAENCVQFGSVELIWIGEYGTGIWDLYHFMNKISVEYGNKWRIQVSQGALTPKGGGQKPIILTIFAKTA